MKLKSLLYFEIMSCMIKKSIYLRIIIIHYCSVLQVELKLENIKIAMVIL